MPRPMGGGPRGMGPGSIKDINKGTIKRLLSYVGKYRIRLIFVVVSIIISAFTGAIASLFLRTLIDDYITPLLVQAVPDFSGLFRVILMMGGLYVIGVLASLFYTRTMVTISQ